MRAVASDFCKVFVDAAAEPDVLAHIAVASLPNPSMAKLEHLGFASYVTYGDIEIDVSRNLDTSPEDEAPDAEFITWPMIIEIEASEHVIEDELVGIVGSLLRSLWDKHFGAIAAADFEARLPRQG